MEMKKYIKKNMTKRQITEARWYSYLHYHHRNTHSLRDSHERYLSVLSYLEDKGNFNIDDLDYKAVLLRFREVLRSLTEEELEDLERIMKI